MVSGIVHVIPFATRSMFGLELSWRELELEVPFSIETPLQQNALESAVDQNSKKKNFQEVAVFVLSFLETSIQ